MKPLGLSPVALLVFSAIIHAQTLNERADQLFSGKDALPILKIEVDKVGLEQIQKDPRKYVRATIRNGDTV
jgi:hypothetical protein